MTAPQLPEVTPTGWAPLGLGELCALVFIVVNLTLAAVWLWRELTSPHSPAGPRRRRRLGE